MVEQAAQGITIIKKLFDIAVRACLPWTKEIIKQFL